MASLLKVDPEVKLKVDSFRERITSEAEDLVANFFPKKLLELDGFLKEPILNIHDLTQIHSDMNLPVPDPILLTNSHDGLDGPNMKKRKLEDHDETFQGTKVFVMPNGMLKSNQQLVDIIEKVKPEIRLLIEKCNTVKMWVQLLIPRIEDGNNFGVSIQEETVAELRTVESEAASYLDQISRYYITRAKLVSKIALLGSFLLSPWKNKVFGKGLPAVVRGQLGPENNPCAVYLSFNISLSLPDTISQEQSCFLK
ncbi:proteasome activator complex subunit 3 isoform X2 [Melospiza georgiana]|uniref:proteasome activator complex subunit 3 isoform X2 n=1 Tax=Melospiza georgiana TaxID=44398 RepID=UPI0025ACA12A|nr:proteasome activator complex subunit 3 isoform X2 [Melospiza georgiana]